MLESLDKYFGLFGTDAVLDDGPDTVRGNFTDPTTELALGRLGVESKSPSFTFSTDDLSTVRAAQSLTIEEIVYTIRQINQDGSGIARADLKR